MLATKVNSSPAQRVFLGMSGGVDSSVAAYLLLQQGYDVIGVYMKNWSRDLPGMKCPWAEDLADAKRIAVRLGIDFRIFDFEKDYKQKVIDYMLAEYQKGNTPNPDIMCNQEIKFKLFFDSALEQGADLIATGHYAKIQAANKSQSAQLLRAADQDKDQSYFLYRVPSAALSRTLFPLGSMQKRAVKALAAELNFPVAHKKESMGVCFVGEADIREFLAEFIDTSPGEIRELESNQFLGFHDGAIYYTLGQRHGLNIGSGLPHYVVKKDMTKNIVYVSKNLNSKSLWREEIQLQDIFLRSTIIDPTECMIRSRHRAELVPAIYYPKQQSIKFASPQKSLTPGQSLVFYGGHNAEICLGGGIITA